MFAVLYKTLFMFVFVVVAIRVMGKRQLGQLEPGELVATIMMSELAAMPIADDMPLLHSVVAIGVILLVEVSMAVLALKSIKLRGLFGGKPSLIINNGMIIKKTMRRNRITIDELVESLREKDITDLSAVKYAVLERGGGLSVVRQSETLPVIIINDGRLLKQNMILMGITEDQIMEELKKRNILDIKDVFLLMLDEKHRFYIYTQLDVA